MPDFTLVPHPQFSPTSCVTCMASRCEYGFVDLLAETAVNGFTEDEGQPIHSEWGSGRPTVGHLYVCAECGFKLARTLGCLDPAQADGLAGELAEMHEQLRVLREALEVAEESKVVPVADLDALAERIWAKRPKPGPKPKATA